MNEESQASPNNTPNLESDKPKKPKFCGHENLHSGDLNLICTAKPGHAGDHTAPYQRLIPNTNPKEYENAVATWSDGAGEPPEEIASRHDAEVIRLAQEKQELLKKVKR